MSPNASSLRLSRPRYTFVAVNVLFLSCAAASQAAGPGTAAPRSHPRRASLSPIVSRTLSGILPGVTPQVAQLRAVTAQSGPSTQAPPEPSETTPSQPKAEAVEQSPAAVDADMKAEAESAPNAAANAAASGEPDNVAAPPTAGPEVAPVPPIPVEDSASPAMVEEPGLAEDGSEEEVVRVTVDRREKNVQDYAGSASALGQADLDRTGVASVRELSSATPYVHIGTQDGNTEVYIRGVGSNNNTELGDPATATHIDGIYIPRPRAVGSMLYDLERVEVNRGPQGTLRGRNATAGSLNIVTNKPRLQEFSAEASSQFGNYSQRLLRGMINIPVGRTLALRLAAYGETHDPFYKNAGPVHTLRATEDANVLSYRASLKWVPNHRITVHLSHDRTQETGAGWSGSLYNAPLSAGLMPKDVPDPRAVIFRGPQARMEQVHWGIGGNLTVDLGPALVEYVGSYRKLDYFQTTAGNAGVAYPGMPEPDIDNWSTSWFDTDSKSLIQELRLFAPDKARLRWTVGGFFFKEWQHTSFATVSDKTTRGVGVEYTMPHMVSDSWAGYADATFDVLKSLRATAGLRLTSEHKERTGVGYNYNFSNPNNEVIRIGTEGFRYAGRDGRTDFVPGGGGPFDDYLNGIGAFGVRDTLPRLLQQPGVTLDMTQLNRQNGGYDGRFLDFRAGTDFDLTPDNLLYVMFSTAHKSGGFNDQIRRTDAAGNVTAMVAPTYKPEVLYSVEVGSKNQFLNRKVTVNSSVFWYEYKDMQFQLVQQIGEAPTGGGTPPASAVRVNAAGSRVLGLETDANWQLPANFVVGTGIMLLNSRFTSGTVADTRLGYDPAQQVPVNLEGRFLPRSPVLSLNYSLAHSFKTRVGVFDWMIHGQTKTKYYMTPFNSEGYDTRGNFAPILSDVNPSYTRFDIAAGWARNEGDVRLDAFVNNVTNATYMTSLIAQPGQNQRFFNAPRQLGVRLTMYL